MLHSPLFIVLEGPDGAGTTLHSKLLAEHLMAKGIDVFLTAEPSAGPIGSNIRARLKSGEQFDPLSLQELFVADRHSHIEHEIKPALAAGKTVICDRYIPSTIVYGKALDIPKDKLIDMNKDFIQPDALLLLLPPYEVCRERVMRRAEKDSLEGDELQRKVYDAYVAYEKDHAGIPLVDTSGPKESVSSIIAAIVGKERA